MARWEFSCSVRRRWTISRPALVRGRRGDDAIEVERNLNLLVRGSPSTRSGSRRSKITDHGKVKACVGPFKA